MNVTWTGKQEYLHQKQREQLDAKLGKIGKLLENDNKGEKQARIVLGHDGVMNRAEVTLNYLDHTLVGEHVDADMFTSVNLAIEKLERQMLRLRERRRDIKKGPREGWDKGAAANTLTAAEPTHPDGIPAARTGNGKPQVFRVEPADSKPLTVDEAMLEIENEPYFVYRDAGTQRLSVLLRRDDGNFELVQC